MPDIKFQIVKPNDTETLQLIAEWYLSEWKIPVEKTIERLQVITADEFQFQVLMTINNTPVSTGGVYNHVGLLDKVPRLQTHKHWMALVYTVPEKRGQGLGAIICKHIQEHTAHSGMKKIHLFTDTAESLYKRLGWTVLEKLSIQDRNIVVMEKVL